MLYCTNCGKKLDENDKKFCSKCNQLIHDKKNSKQINSLIYQKKSNFVVTNKNRSLKKTIEIFAWYGIIMGIISIPLSIINCIIQNYFYVVMAFSLIAYSLFVFFSIKLLKSSFEKKLMWLIILSVFSLFFLVLWLFFMDNLQSKFAIRTIMEVIYSIFCLLTFVWYFWVIGKNKKLQIILLITFLIVIIFAIAWNFDKQMIDNKINEEKKPLSKSLIEEIVNKIKQNMSFPYKIDDATTLMFISPLENGISYQYTIEYEYKDYINFSEIENKIVKKICADSQMLEIINLGLDFKYNYHISGTKDDYSFVVNLDVCN